MTATRPRLWSLNRQAAKAVALNATDVDDARMLLDVLGLVDGPEGRKILPDDRRALDIELLRACPGEPSRDDVLAERPAKATTVPAGLTAAVESTPPPSPPPVAAPAAPPPLLEPDMPDLMTATPPPRRAGRPPVPIEHGTEKGYLQHKRKRQPIPADDACGCQAAHDATLKRPAAANPPADVERPVDAPSSVAAPSPTAIPAKRTAPALDPIEHGTVDGYHAHLDRGALPVCSDCRSAVDELTAGVQTTTEPPPPLAPVDLDVWFTAAQQSTSTTVRRAGRAASTALLQLCQAMDELARAERVASQLTEATK
jgi:hypothetical protein